MIKHTAPNQVLSHFNPIVALKPSIKKMVNEQYLLQIAAQFFSDKGGIEDFEPLDMDKIKTEIDFDLELNFVNNYLYPEIIETITKEENGKVVFKPKYVFTFDSALTKKSSNVKYPYISLIRDYDEDPENIHYGCMRLGDEPVLYYIWLDIQMLIQYIKQFPDKVDWENVQPENIITEKQGISQIQTALEEIEKEKINTSDTERLRVLEEQENILRAQRNQSERALQGKAGKLRINLQWDTTDDLDLHVIDPGSNEIYYGNKSSMYEGKRGSLDVDANSGAPYSNDPQENIAWEMPPEGKFKVYVSLFKKRDFKDRIPFTVKILPSGKQGRIFSGVISTEKEKLKIATFKFDKNTGLISVKKKV